MLSVSRRERGFGVGKRESKALLIDCEKHVALVHELIVPHANIINITGNVGRHCHHIGADTGVPGPWRIEIVSRHIVAEQTTCNEQDESKQDTYDGLHRYLLQWLVMTSAPTQKRQTKSTKRASDACKNRRYK